MDTIGKYEIVGPLATGGMAKVFLARTTGLGGFVRHVVLKVLDDGSSEQVRMFLDEARLVGLLHHPNINQVFDVGCSGTAYYLAMEFVHGADLRTIQCRAASLGMRLSLNFSLTIIRAVAAALHYSHELRGADGHPLGIVHRDVSPSNVIASHDGSVKLIDFGIARSSTQTTTTNVGFLKGKAGYMAPEYIRGRALDRRSDVFALGVLMYELTTHRRAFDGADAFHRILRGDLPRPSQIVADYPPDLERVVLAALEQDPADRTQSASALIAALDQVTHHHGIHTGPDRIADQLLALYGHRPAPWIGMPSVTDQITIARDRTGSGQRPTRRLGRGTGPTDATDDVEIDIEVETSTTRDLVALDALIQRLPVPTLPRPRVQLAADRGEHAAHGQSLDPRGKSHARTETPTAVPKPLARDPRGESHARAPSPAGAHSVSTPPIPARDVGAPESSLAPNPAHGVSAPAQGEPARAANSARGARGESPVGDRRRESPSVARGARGARRESPPAARAPTPARDPNIPQTRVRARRPPPRWHVVLVCALALVCGVVGGTVIYRSLHPHPDSIAGLIPRLPIELPSVSAPPAPPKPATVELRVTTTPPGAQVELEGNPLGRSPLLVELPRRTGTSRVLVQLPGHRAVEQLVELTHDRELVVPLVACKHRRDCPR